MSYQKILNEEFEMRLNRNSAYSLRAFARDLGISHSSLSRVLTGEQGLSAEKTALIAKKLNFSQQESTRFKSLVLAACARSPQAREWARLKLKETDTSEAQVSLEYFRAISDWWHFAIIELTQVKDFQSDPKWISERLQIPLADTKEAIARLLKLELMEISPTGKLLKNVEFRATPSGTPDRSIKMNHQQILKKAEAALFEQSAEERDFSNITFAMNTETLAWAQKELKKFRRALTRRLAADQNKDRLYSLAIQLFALDKKWDKKNES